MEQEIELPDGRILVVNPETDDLDAIRAEISKQFSAEGLTPATQEAPAAEPEKDPFLTRLGRGAKRIVTGDVSPAEFGRAAETTIRSATGPLGGDFLAAGGENIARAATGRPNNPDAVKRATWPPGAAGRRSSPTGRSIPALRLRRHTDPYH